MLSTPNSKQTEQREVICFEVKIEESKKAGSRLESNPGHLACGTSALPLSYDNQTTTRLTGKLSPSGKWFLSINA